MELLTLPFALTILYQVPNAFLNYFLMISFRSAGKQTMHV
jgi:hypothetical protein